MISTLAANSLIFVLIYALGYYLRTIITMHEMLDVCALGAKKPGNIWFRAHNARAGKARAKSFISTEQ